VRFDLGSAGIGSIAQAKLQMRLRWGQMLPQDVDLWGLPPDHPDAQGDITASRWYGESAPWKPDGRFDGSGLIHLGKLPLSRHLADGSPLDFTSRQLTQALSQRAGQTLTLVLSTQHQSDSPVILDDLVLTLVATPPSTQSPSTPAGSAK
jgi:hypothetical protein